MLSTEPVYVADPADPFTLIPDPSGATARVKWRSRCTRDEHDDDEHISHLQVTPRPRFQYDGQIVELDDLRAAASASSGS